MTPTQRTGATKKEPQRGAGISPARKAAFQILLAVEQGPSHSDELLRGKTVNSLSAADRNLATALVLGVLRWQILLDHQLHSLLAKPNAKLDAEIRIALRLGAFQLLYLDRIPARAAIDESVELAKQAGHRFAARMVNAVLRKLAHASSAQKNAAKSDSIAGLALCYAHPQWMVERWVSFFGMAAAQAICAHGQQQAPSTIRLLNSDVEQELPSAGIEVAPAEFLTDARRVLAGDVTASQSFRDGRARLQDEGSQLVAELCASSFDQTVRSICDLCAAPGGKTLILAERNPKARIVACEISPPRHAQLQQRLSSLGDRVECRLADAATLEVEEKFDLVLVDAPCSGTGTLGRNPEIRHRLRVEALSRQAERQRTLLHAALRAVRPGGRVVYSTCSIEPEENEEVLAAILAESTGARVVSLAESIGALREKGILTREGAERLRAALSSEGFLRLCPSAFQSDGFFIALLERTA